MTSTRLIAGFSGLAIVLPILIWGGVLGVAILVGLVLLIAQDEFAGMAMPEAKNRARALLFPGGLAIFGVLGYLPSQWALPTVAFAVIAALLFPMFTQPDLPKAGEETTRLTLGLLYAPVLLVPLTFLHRREDGIALVFLTLAVTWLGDTGAYFAGRFFGKTKLFERVSPKKTVEGFLGGLFLSVVGAICVKLIGHPDLGWGELIGIAAVMDVAGVVGDLAESMLKRAWGVKDSGWIMPGHGGILDRIDSLLFSAPVLWLFLSLR